MEIKRNVAIFFADTIASAAPEFTDPIDRAGKAAGLPTRALYPREQHAHAVLCLTRALAAALAATDARRQIEP
jgi:hypothetical protein